MSFLSRFLKDPRKIHFAAAEKVLHYLYTTRGVKIVYRETSNNCLKIYSAASYADNSDMKSTFGYIVKYAGGAVSWGSKKIPCVVLSTAEAEYIAASESLKEVIWIDELLRYMGIRCSPHQLLVDNQSALKLLDHPINHSKTKHIRVKFHFFREHVAKGTVVPQYLNTEDQMADVNTKITTREQSKTNLESLTKCIFEAVSMTTFSLLLVLSLLTSATALIFLYFSVFIIDFLLRVILSGLLPSLNI
ncbi:Ty1/Copia family ribonuclease HI KNAG_0J01130 [Huiozyma naganishii CBS 8797]|uniref:Reverse transcriptase Ty1/copia-type domain-containing protein n=1 Tax=Huiozyma naganishii (strain ATCC MYA-139 / BCRC 22969 / CBS 8797 / KCTC 17520 / NBRC 10181 / NCYC 3082 / Yp74L-3) TaxID=1071383 RepID=J7RBE1_HUIN7|nr:hypothetical protein KNAG_0J01130 [Kazachstania naganishii CBS 8797]CCK72195.1 hypothetical protein KNAG_0J01130 [Kazachstania naganishii CBS 8797]